jgi:lipopolysaccharide export system protein LptA
LSAWLFNRFWSIAVKRFAGFAAGLVLLTNAPAAMAFFGGDDEPMYVEADRVDIDDARGESRYKGSVEVNQGGVYIAGDSMITYQNDKGDVDKVVTTGKQAVFTQKPGKDKKAMNA